MTDHFMPCSQFGQRFAHLFAKADTMQMVVWQKDLISVACYICACMKLHATLLEE